MSTHVAASSQLFYSLATLVIMKARPRLAEDKLDEIEGIRAEVLRYGTKRTKYKKKLVWGFSCTVRTWKLTFKKKDLQIGTKKIRTDTSVRMVRTKRPWEQEKMRVNYAGKRQRGTKLPSSPKKIQTVGATRLLEIVSQRPRQKSQTGTKKRPDGKMLGGKRILRRPTTSK